MRTHQELFNCTLEELRLLGVPFRFLFMTVSDATGYFAVVHIKYVSPTIPQYRVSLSHGESGAWVIQTPDENRRKPYYYVIVASAKPFSYKETLCYDRQT